MTGLPCYAAVDGYGLGDVTSTDVVRYAPADIDCAELEVHCSWSVAPADADAALMKEAGGLLLLLLGEPGDTAGGREEARRAMAGVCSFFGGVVCALVLRDVPALLTGQMRCLRMAFARAPPVAPSVAHAK